MLEHEGKLYARVSDILKPFVNFAGISQEVLSKKASLGTLVHKLINEEIEGLLPVASGKELGYVQSFYQWRNAVNPVFIESEVRYYCDQKMITGCIDALIQLQPEEPAVLVDFKTSVQESPTWILQAHLYHYLLTTNGKNPAKRMLFLKLDKEGALPKVFEYKLDVNVLNRCMQAIQDYWTKW
jgi:hypothetical protein